MANNKKGVPMVNIGGPEMGELGFDPHYRYQREQVLLKKQAEAKVAVNAYAKTVWVNMEEIAEDLVRPRKLLEKYVRKSLSTQIKWMDKTKELVINGQHEKEKLEKVVNKFIEDWVECHECSKPETTIHVNDKIEFSCGVCGKWSEISKATKLYDYVMKNPPTTTSKGQFASSIETKKNDIDPEAAVRVEALKAALAKQNLSIEINDEKPKDHMKCIKSIKKKQNLNGINIINMIMDTYLEQDNLTTQLKATEPLFARYVTRARHRKAFLDKMKGYCDQMEPKQLKELREVLMEYIPFQLDDAAADLDKWLQQF